MHSTRVIFNFFFLIYCKTCPYIYNTSSFENNTAKIKDRTILNQIRAFFLNEQFSRINLLTSLKHFWKWRTSNFADYFNKCSLEL